MFYVLCFMFYVLRFTFYILYFLFYVLRFIFIFILKNFVFCKYKNVTCYMLHVSCGKVKILKFNIMIKRILDEIAAEGGTNAKMEILEKYKDNELLKKADSEATEITEFMKSARANVDNWTKSFETNLKDKVRKTTEIKSGASSPKEDSAE